MKYFFLTFCLALFLISRVSCETCDSEEFRKCYLNAATNAEEDACLELPGCEEIAEAINHPLEIDIPDDEDE